MTEDSTFIGLFGPNSWDPRLNPESWEQSYYKVKPNGRAPLTAILSNVKTDTIDNFIHSWPVSRMATACSALTAGQVYTDVGMSVAYTSGGVSGAPIYIKTAAAFASQCRKDMTIVLLVADVSAYSCALVLTGNPVINGASSMLPCKLIEADDNQADYTMANADYAILTGTLHERGSAHPSPMTTSLTWLTDFSRTFRNSAAITDSDKNTKTRLGVNEWDRRKAGCHETHVVSIEDALYWSKRNPDLTQTGNWTFEVGDNGEPKTSFMGIFEYVATYGDSQIVDFRTDPDFAGKTWVQGGPDWLDVQMQELYRYGEPTRVGLCGGGLIKGLNQLARAFGTLQIASGTREFGTKITEWVTGYGPLPMKTAPLMNERLPFRNSVVLFNPTRSMKLRYVKNRKNRWDDYPRNSDGDSGGFTSELVVEYGPVEEFRILHGVGMDNTVS